MLYEVITNALAVQPERSGGATILATGGKEHQPDNYQFGRHPKIMTHLGFSYNFV